MSSRRVRLGLGCLLAFAGLTSGCSALKWQRDYETGMKQAAQSGRRALVQFHSSMNMDCREMDNDVFTDPDVQQLLQNFILIRVDDVLNRQLSRQFGVQVLPSFFIIRPDVTVAGAHAGKMDKEKFRYFLINHTFD